MSTIKSKIVIPSGEYLSPAEVAALRSVSRCCVYNWIKTGMLRSVKDRYGRRFVKRTDAEAFVPNPAGYPLGVVRKKDTAKIKKARAMRARGKSYREISETLGISFKKIYYALNRKNGKEKTQVKA